MDVQIAAKLFNSVDDSLKNTLATGTAKVMLGIAAVVGTFWIIQFTLRNIQWLFKGMSGVFEEVVYEILKVAFIGFCAFNVAWYIATVVPFVTNFPVWMGGIMSGSDGAQTNQVDAIVTTYLNNLLLLLSAMKAEVADWKFGEAGMSILIIVFYLSGGIPFISLCVGTLITLKVATTLMLVVGPIFIAFALFDKTRQWFWGWVSLIAGFMLTQVLFSVVIGLEIAFINKVIINNGKISMDWIGTFSILIYFSAFTLLAVEIPSYAASIMGATPAGGVGGLGRIMGKAGGAATALRMSGAVSKMIKQQVKQRIGQGRNNIK